MKKCGHMNKKKILTLIFFCFFLTAGLGTGMYICKKVEGEGAGIEAAQKAAEVKEEGGGLADSGRSEATGKSAANSLETAIHYQVVYNMEIASEEMAASAIKEEGRKQRENYDNPAVEEIELKMEEEFGIFAVNLGEMSVETAGAVYEAFAYMYGEYPCLKGTLTNLTLGNMGNRTGGIMAVTDRMAFVVNGDYGYYPFVEKYYIVLNARKFLDDEELGSTALRLSRSGYWIEGSDTSSIVVHELGHQLQNVIVQKKFGLECPYYITEENGEAFGAFNTDRLSPEDNTTNEILTKAYNRWRNDYGHEGEYEEFVLSISGYAMGDEKEGRYSPSETFAEGVTDLYLRGDNAADASKAIGAVIWEYLER